LTSATELRIVIDASVYIDLFAGRSKERVQIAEELFNCIKSKRGRIRLYGPRLLLVELAGVLIRYIPPRIVSDIVERVKMEVVLLDDGVFCDACLKRRCFCNVNYPAC